MKTECVRLKTVKGIRVKSVKPAWMEKVMYRLQAMIVYVAGTSPISLGYVKRREIQNNRNRLVKERF